MQHLIDAAIQAEIDKSIQKQIDNAIEKGYTDPLASEPANRYRIEDGRRVRG